MYAEQMYIPSFYFKREFSRFRGQLEEGLKESNFFKKITIFLLRNALKSNLYRRRSFFYYFFVRQCQQKKEKFTFKKSASALKEMETLFQVKLRKRSSETRDDE